MIINKLFAVWWGILGGLFIALVLYAVQAIGMQSFTSPYYYSLERWYFILPLITGFGVQVGLYKAIRVKQRMLGVVVASGSVSAVSMVLCCMHNFAWLLPILGLSGASVFFGLYQDYIFGFSILFVFGGVVYMYLKYRELVLCEVAGGDAHAMKVKGVYAIGRAKWYDFFKKIWNKITAKKAEKELKEFLRANISKNTSILELGCGTALNLEKIRSLSLKFGRYFGADFSKDMLAIAKKKFDGASNIKFKEADITKFDTEEKFDVILCTWVLSHLERPSEFVNGAQRFLNENGKMFFTFFLKPRWYVSFWFGPVASSFFKADYVSDDEVAKFNNVKLSHKYFAGLVTTVKI